MITIEDTQNTVLSTISISSVILHWGKHSEYQTNPFLLICSLFFHILHETHVLRSRYPPRLFPQIGPKVTLSFSTLSPCLPTPLPTTPVPINLLITHCIYILQTSCIIRELFIITRGVKGRGNIKVPGNTIMLFRYLTYTTVENF